MEDRHLAGEPAPIREPADAVQVRLQWREPGLLHSRLVHAGRPCVADEPLVLRPFRIRVGRLLQRLAEKVLAPDSEWRARSQAISSAGSGLAASHFEQANA